jgi:hypothetical protein
VPVRLGHAVQPHLQWAASVYGNAHPKRRNRRSLDGRDLRESREHRALERGPVQRVSAQSVRVVTLRLAPRRRPSYGVTVCVAVMVADDVTTSPGSG